MYAFTVGMYLQITTITGLLRRKGPRNEDREDTCGQMISVTKGTQIDCAA